ncbi:MAG: YjbQ family protein [Thermoflexales bacterium]|nr:YjbQ family protein [Thermoflexales bacterium]
MIQTLSISTRQHSQMIDITGEVQAVLSKSGIQDGLVVVYCPHTTAGLTINEDADPTVRADILDILDRLVPWQANYRHAEGNSAAHIKASLMGSSVSVPVEQGRMILGRWQGIYFCEFDGPRSRRVQVQILSEAWLAGESA